jgi:ribosomal-protein-alanine N-acetyltransferase
MCVEDIPEVTEIDREAFPTEWFPSSLKRELNNKMTRHIVACEETREVSGLYPSDSVTDIKARSRIRRLFSRMRRLFFKRSFDAENTIHVERSIVGYVSFWLMADEAHITSIAVRESYRRKGIGELLIIAAINMASELKADVVTLEVRSTNLSAQALYNKYGLNKVGIRRRYYSDDGEDAVIMTTEQLNSLSYQERLDKLKKAYVKRWGTEHVTYPLNNQSLHS